MSKTPDRETDYFILPSVLSSATLKCFKYCSPNFHNVNVENSSDAYNVFKPNQTLAKYFCTHYSPSGRNKNRSTQVI